MRTHTRTHRECAPALAYSQTCAERNSLLLHTSYLWSARKRCDHVYWQCRRQRRSRLAPSQLQPASQAGKVGGDSKRGQSIPLACTGSSSLSNCSRAGMTAALSQWESPPVKGSRPLQKVHLVPYSNCCSAAAMSVNLPCILSAKPSTSIYC